MVRLYQCQKCGQIITEGGFIFKTVDKCPKCGSRWVMPIEFSPRYWFYYLKLLIQKNK